MPNSDPNTQGLDAAAKRRSQNKFAAAKKALSEMIRAGETITFASVARQAGCSQNYLYTNPKLRQQIIRHRGTNVNSNQPDVSVNETHGQQQIIDALRHQIRHMEAQHKAQIKDLRKELDEANQAIEFLTAELILLRANEARS
ncbi:DUF6262 family protein [Kocuria sp. ZOR0020]|uniref:DUF6262 family protein n=1 Tax=Kocuria sp. ZOR0020 TaxID=1339234 RepID=UPI0012E06DED|nr:DUF6262 family protein [Kocuria sp. ZOR0020]